MKLRCFFLLPLLPLLFLLQSCELLGSVTLSATAYPTQVVGEKETITTYSSDSFFDIMDYIENNAGDDIYADFEDTDDLMYYIRDDLPLTGVDYEYSISVTEQIVSNVSFNDYCSWYDPNTTLEITLSSISEESVSNSITTSITAALGLSGTLTGSLSATVSTETTKTVSYSEGISVATSYDLTQYDQSKMYKVILMGAYTITNYNVCVIDGDEVIEEYDFESIEVDQDSLAVRLVYKTE